MSSVPHGSSVAAEPSKPDDIVTFKEVEQALVAAALLWWRTPGSLGPSGRGGMPASGRGGGIQIGVGFGKDGPWELADRDLYGPDVDKDAPLRSAPLSRAEVAVREAISAWLLWAPERDRRLVALAVRQMASRRYKSPKFMELREAMGISLGADGLRMRYNRAVHGIALKLNCDAAARKAARLRR